MEKAQLNDPEHSLEQQSQQMLTEKQRNIGFAHLPTELRREICGLVLRQDEPVRHRNHPLHYNGPLDRALVYVNKVISQEACCVFYGQNRIDLRGLTAGQVGQFFQDIGSLNASHIQHIMTTFPQTILPGAEGEVGAIEATDSRLTLIKRHCQKIRTLSFSAYISKDTLDIFDQPHCAEGAIDILHLVDEHFRVGRDLQQITVGRPCSPEDIRYYMTYQSPGLASMPNNPKCKCPLEEAMKDLGWTVIPVIALRLPGLIHTDDAS
jgi:hypothetical protein